MHRNSSENQSIEHVFKTGKVDHDHNSSINIEYKEIVAIE
jgi:hypothetical protein